MKDPSVTDVVAWLYPNLTRIPYSVFQAGGHDYDNDGKDNGEELTIFKGADGKFKANRTSDMLNPDTDGDGILDGNDTAPTEKGMANGIVGQLSIVSQIGKDDQDITHGHAFLLYKSYVNDCLDLQGFYAGYLLGQDGEYAFFPPNELDYHSLPLKSNQVVSFGNFPDDSGYNTFDKYWNQGTTVMVRFLNNCHIPSLPYLPDQTVIGIRSLDILRNEIPGGAHYNVEIKDVVSSNDSQGPNIALTREITEEQLNQILDYFAQHSYYNLLRNNCVKLAGAAWNETFNDTLEYESFNVVCAYSAYTPLKLRQSIEKRKNISYYHVFENIDILNPPSIKP